MKHFVAATKKLAFKRLQAQRKEEPISRHKSFRLEKPFLVLFGNTRLRLRGFKIYSIIVQVFEWKFDFCWLGMMNVFDELKQHIHIHIRLMKNRELFENSRSAFSCVVVSTRQIHSSCPTNNSQT